MRVIIKQPTEPIGHMLTVKNDLHELQRIVRGPIEVVPVGGSMVMICNEEGKLRNLKPNFRIPSDTIVGTVIVCGTDGEEFCDVPINLEMWGRLIDKWKQ